MMTHVAFLRSLSHLLLAPRWRHVAAVLLALLPLAACDRTRYQPYHTIDIPLIQHTSWGYSEVPVRPDYFQVGFADPDNGSPTTARYYATLRAAEVAILHGTEYFEVIQAWPGESPLTWTAISAPTTQRSAEIAAAAAERYAVNLDSASSNLLIHLLPGPNPAALSARQILLDGREHGVTFSPAVESFLGAPAHAPAGR